MVKPEGASAPSFQDAAMADKHCRLRKYLRKKRRAKTAERFVYYARLYWRYHYQVYGPLICLWALDGD